MTAAPPNTLDRLRSGAHVAVIRLRSMGDCVLTTPALELLHRARPDLRIAVVAEPRFAGVFEKNPAIAVVLPPDYPAILRWRPSLSLNLHGGTRSMLLTLASLARYRAGFAQHWASTIYNLKIPRAQQILGEERTVHTAEHLATAMYFLGVTPGDIPRAFLFAEPRPATRPYAVIHAASAALYKTWRPDGFLAAADHIQRQRGLEPIFIGSAGDDLTPFSGYRTVAGAPLSDLKSLLAGASLFVGNDSGPAHMACALGVPVVVLYGRLEHSQIWAPWKPVASAVLASPAGITGITVAEVLAAIDGMP